ncbi:Epoxyqueuosine reductase QueG (queuosine biosynthesis) [Anaerovirgula multivorans]|uniref:Epoxyqueuosine reductase QueG (Queuosine biosynthesis) n=1 Tax=Anaerovirgula multivorans TaxID=312168 RepID=A0A239BT74_9FIRM|nr:epoxyqueuosine reductase [Anaerovirgula multivorans]SNS11225.1 Epoxyqueuosine reductase QueG (queuosine biosynthesis) [Anaerovirgula multivorans]
MKEKIEKYIKEFVKKYPEVKGTETRWKEPLIAYADAKNPMFLELKKIVVPTHGIPTDFLQDAKTVITYFLPFEGEVVKSNIKGKESSRTWGMAYIETNRLILDLNTYLHEKIQELGYQSTIIPATHNFDVETLISEWSHRHVAYIAGLGKFGLNNMFITEKGCCGRVGSIVTNIKIEATEVKEEEYCLYKTKAICKKCVEGCINGALTVDGYDRHKCYEMCLHNDEYLGDIGVTDVCGKCMVGVPCSFRNPTNPPKISNN